MARTFEKVSYNGKHFEIPIIDPKEGCVRITPDPSHLAVDRTSKVVRDLGCKFDIEKFLDPRTPVSIGKLDNWERELFSKPSDARNVLDLPVKFPWTDVRLPNEFAQWAPVIQRFINAERELDPRGYEQSMHYLTIRRGPVKKGGQHHYAPCHVDGFQGARWVPKRRANRSVTVADKVKTVYYPQAFDLRALDLAKHDAFWEMNRQVALTNNAHAWTDYELYELMLMDAFCVHIAGDAEEDCERTWFRYTSEDRIFDRLGNAHNPHFGYDWKMVPRDIEQLGLVAFDPTSDPSLRVFPWQATDGTPNPDGVSTKPKLTTGE